MAKITIVDSDTSNIAYIKTCIEQPAHRLSFISNASELIKQLSNQLPDIIIIAVDLEGGDGRELSRFLNAEPRYRNIPVILTSPYYHTENDVKTFFSDDLIATPFEGSALVTSIESLLEKKLITDMRLEKLAS